MIHSVDSIKLASEIDKRARAHGLVMDILVEINIGGEETKSGISPEELNAFIQSGSFPAPDMDALIRQAAGGLSKELLVMKFLQGVPIVGALGGAFDAVYMKRVMAYAELKYRRRFYYNKMKLSS